MISEVLVVLVPFGMAIAFLVWLNIRLDQQREKWMRRSSDYADTIDDLIRKWMAANMEIGRYQAALENIATGASGNAGRCLDCDTIAGLARAALDAKDE